MSESGVMLRSRVRPRGQPPPPQRWTSHCSRTCADGEAAALRINVHVVPSRRICVSPTIHDTGTSPIKREVEELRGRYFIRGLPSRIVRELSESDSQVRPTSGYDAGAAGIWDVLT
jgi:hypothetical protein